MLIPVKSIVGIKLVIFIMNAINKFSFPRHHYVRLPALPTLPTGRQAQKGNVTFIKTFTLP